MACDWIEFDKNFDRKPKVLRLIELTLCTVDEATGRMHRFWSWVDDHVGPDARVGLSIDTVARMFGGDASFWEALKDDKIQWLGEHTDGTLVIPRWKVRFSKSAKQRRNANRRQARKRSRDSGLTSHKSVTHSRDKAVTKTSTTGQDRRGDNRTTDDKTVEETSQRAPGARQKTGRTDATDPAEKLPKAGRGVVGLAPGPTAGAVGPMALVGADRAFDWDEARRVANEVVARKLGLGASRLAIGDRSLVLKASALVEVLGEHWLHDAVEAVRLAYARESPPAGPRCAYLHGVLASKCAEAGFCPLDAAGDFFNGLLARVNVPQGLLVPPTATHTPVGAT